VFVCIFFSCGLFTLLCVPGPTQYRFHTPMTRYSLYVLKVPLNTKQTNKPSTNSLYRPDALPDTQPTMSKHWRHLKDRTGVTMWCVFHICYALVNYRQLIRMNHSLEGLVTQYPWVDVLAEGSLIFKARQMNNIGQVLQRNSDTSVRLVSANKTTENTTINCQCNRHNRVGLPKHRRSPKHDRRSPVLDLSNTTDDHRLLL